MNVFKSIDTILSNRSLKFKIENNEIKYGDISIHIGVFQYFIQHGLLTTDGESMIHSKHLRLILDGGFKVLSFKFGSAKWYDVVANDWVIHDMGKLSTLQLGFLCSTGDKNKKNEYINIQDVVEISSVEEDLDKFALPKDILELLEQDNNIVKLNNIYSINNKVLDPAIVKYNIATNTLVVDKVISIGKCIYKLKNNHLKAKL